MPENLPVGTIMGFYGALPIIYGIFDLEAINGSLAYGLIQNYNRFGCRNPMINQSLISSFIINLMP
jgi:hypothetical protein